MGGRPFRLCSASALASAQVHATQALQRWSSGWIGPSPGAQVTVQISQSPRALAAANEEAGWLRAQGDQGTVWAETSQQALLGRLLFGPGGGVMRPGTLATSAAAQALEALVQELAASDSVQQATAPLH